MILRYLIVLYLATIYIVKITVKGILRGI